MKRKSTPFFRNMTALLSLIGLIAAAGCSKEHGSGRTAAVRIAPTIESRATALNFESGDCIGLDIERAAEHYAMNEPLTYDGSSFVSERLVWYADGSDPATLTAYYPYAAAGRPDRFTVAADQSAGLAASDLLAAKRAQVTPSATAVAMTFRHLLVRLVIDLQNATVAEIGTVELSGLTGTATIDWSQLTAAASDGAMTITPYYDASSEKYMAILVPQEGRLTVCVITKGGQREEQTVPVALEGAKSYSLALSLTEEGLSVVVSGDITDWEDGGSLKPDDPDASDTPNGKEDPEPGDDPKQPSDTEQVTVGEVVYAVRTIGGKSWMSENLRTLPAGQSADADGSGVWSPGRDGAAAPELAASVGYLYNYETAKRLCPSGWHLPSRAELEALIGAETGTAFFQEASFRKVSAGIGTYDKAVNYLLGESVGGGESLALRFDSAGAIEIKELDAEFGYSVRYVKD
ncbi:MAG: fimbrillin family protein [Alistipes sp.]|nr:fimbrillin family protein [Alistipes sp.]